jgi:hypothetical protein
MSERQNTVVCSFDLAGPRMTACDVHDWIFEVLRLPENEVRIIQIDGTKRQVFIKLADQQAVMNLLQATTGKAECKHHDGEITQVAINVAGMSFKRIRVANLPPEVKEEALKAVWEGNGHKGRNMFESIQVCCSQWHKTGYGDLNQAHPVPFNC